MLPLMDIPHNNGDEDRLAAATSRKEGQIASRQSRHLDDTDGDNIR